MIFGFGYSRQRRNHVRLVFQNILASQELVQAALVIHEDDSVAKEVSNATRSLLTFSRRLATELCERKSILSSHNLEEQLRGNTVYRNSFKTAKDLLPRVYANDFDTQFIPHCGWRDFDKRFQRDGKQTLKDCDPFWPDD